MPTRKNHPNVAPSEPCCSGAISSANFNPGDKSINKGAGIVGSFSAASANPTNPSGKATTAGNTIRNNTRPLIDIYFSSRAGPPSRLRMY